MQKKLKIGFIGGGINSAIGQTHRIASQMDNKCILLSGCFSRNVDINKETAKLWGVKKNRVYQNYHQMIMNEKEKLDAFVVLTPTHSHYEIIKTLLENRCNVIVDKAMVSTKEEALLLLSLLDKTETFLAITYNYTGYPMLKELKYMITKGLLGGIKQIMIEMPQESFIKHDRNGHTKKPQEWRLKDQNIATISLDLGVHCHHLVKFFTNEKPLKIVATHNQFGSFESIVDNVNAIIKYTNGLICNVWYSKAALGNRNGLKVRLCGEKASVEWYQMNPEILTFSDEYGNINIIDRATNSVEIASDEKYNRFKPGHPIGFIEAFANCYVDTAEALNKYKKGKSYKESQYFFCIDDALEGLILMDKITQSSIQERWCNFDD